MKTFPSVAAPDGLYIHEDHPSLSVDASVVRALVETILRGERREIASLNVILTRGEVVHKLNERWLGHDYGTDVLSFTLAESDAIEGEVYVSLDFAQEHCDAFDATFTQEVCRYVAHGMLHLVGYKDASASDRAAMRRLEDKYLRECEILSAT